MAAPRSPHAMPALPPMSFLSESFCVVTLGLLVGWYYLLLLTLPLLFYFSIQGNIYAIAIQVILATLSILPLSYKPWKAFMNSWIFQLWKEYFDFKFDTSHSKFNVKEKKYMFLEFPHGIFPMGQFVSASIIEEGFPGEMICGTGTLSFTNDKLSSFYLNVFM